ncbi:hypothetical protein [Streptomyces hygroscopicus]|uniref:hypothetical protein n=1 Tax=Streptomyces hygroscopicus TaxID=1912 RepID=UPI0037A33741
MPVVRVRHRRGDATAVTRPVARTPSITVPTASRQAGSFAVGPPSFALDRHGFPCRFVNARLVENLRDAPGLAGNLLAVRHVRHVRHTRHRADGQARLTSGTRPPAAARR